MVIRSILWYSSMHNIFNLESFISSDISLAMSSFWPWVLVKMLFFGCVGVLFLCISQSCAVIFSYNTEIAVSIGLQFFVPSCLFPGFPLWGFYGLCVCPVGWLDLRSHSVGFLTDCSPTHLRFWLWFSIRVRGIGLQLQKHVFFLYFLWPWTMTHKTAWSHPSTFPWAL